jgi:hypothetical protein
MMVKPPGKTTSGGLRGDLNGFASFRGDLNGFASFRGDLNGFASFRVSHI